MPLRPEHEVIVLCAHTDPTPEQVSRLQALVAGDLDWKAVLRAAERHRVVPLVHHNLRCYAASAVPKQTLTALQAQALSIARGNMALVAELVRLLKRFEAEQIMVIPIKGPAVASTLYGSLALRGFRDLDLLVHPRDFLRAQQLLLAEQYPRVSREKDLTWHASERRRYYHRRYEHVVSRTGVELHWDLATRSLSLPFLDAYLQEHLQPGSPFNATAMTLAPEDMLMVLCVKGSKKLWCDLTLICDIAQWLQRYPDPDQQLVLKRARALHIERELLLALSLAATLLDARIPAALCAAVHADRALPMLTAHYSRQLFFPPKRKLFWLLKRLELNRSYLALRSHPVDRLRLYMDCIASLGTLLTQPSWKDRAFVNLPPSLSFLYYLGIRPLRLTTQAGTWLLQDVRYSLARRRVPAGRRAS